MALPNGPVTLSVDQVKELSDKLSSMRHDVNNHLSLIVAAAELIKFNQEMAARMSPTLAEQPAKISEELRKFSVELEKALGVSRG